LIYSRYEYYDWLWCVTYIVTTRGHLYTLTDEERKQADGKARTEED